jgi:hypothetical protein
LDSDRRAAYFRQAAFGVPIRMALIALILGISRDHALQRYPAGFKPDQHPLYDQANNVGITCANQNCIVHDPLDGKYARNRFHLVDGRRLRCFYCETDIADFVIASKKTKHYETDLSRLRGAGRLERDAVFFASADGAEAAGYSLPKRRRKAANA